MAPIVSSTSDVLSTSPLYASSLDLVEGLAASMEERAVIAQATGVLMETNQWTSAEAFDVLRDRAQVQGSLEDAATAIVAQAAEGGTDARYGRPGGEGGI